MTVTVPNRPPYFTDGTTAFADVTVPMNSIYNLPLPSYSDPDLTSVTLTFSQSSSPTVTVSSTFSTNFQISPTLFTEVGDHSTYFVLDDGLTKVNVPLMIKVTNTAPYFTTFPISLR